MLKKWEKSLLMGLVFTIIISTVSFGGQCSSIRKNVLRLHILANSDSKEDQALKLKVRDALLKEGNDLFLNCNSTDSAKLKAKTQIADLERVAKNVIKQEGYSYPIKIEIGKSDFETRQYDSITLPAGKYDAVRVLIGEAEGQNWWCVMFPPMCLPAAQNQKELDDVLTKSENDIVTNENTYRVEFKIVEWFYKLTSIF